MEYLIEYGIFTLEAITIAVVILLVLAGIIAIISAAKNTASSFADGKINIKKLNEKYSNFKDSFVEETFSDKDKKKYLAEQKKQDKKSAKNKKSDSDTKQPRVFVLNYIGDVNAKANSNLREEVSAILQVASAGDEVLVKLESPGGVVHGYGLAASQLQRLKSKEGLTTTIAIDLVAASGGYMMAVVSDKIIAAPFAIVGSIGVVGQLPNFNKVLKKAGIDYEMHTAGEFKRSLTFFGENTEADRQKFQEDIDNIHQLFKKHISTNRPQIDIDTVANGDTWYGQEAADNHLVDSIETSDDYILQKIADEHLVLEVSYKVKESLQQKLLQSASAGIEKSILKAYQIATDSSLFSGKRF